MFACTGVRGAGDNEGLLAWTAREHRIVRSYRHHCPVEIVSIVLRQSIEMFGVGL
jgi:hypothetical protein